jgi:hypothetical protein
LIGVVEETENAQDFVLDEDGFANAGLGASRAHREGACKAKPDDENNAATQNHFNTDRFIPYRTGARAHAML